MTRLSDRAFQLVKDEVDRYYTPPADEQLSQKQNLERVILLARLETLHNCSGEALTSVQLWESICDILPQIDRDILREAGHRHPESPLMETSLGVCAISLSAAAVLLASPLGASTQPISGSSQASSQINLAAATIKFPTTNRHQDTFETARSFGWQASVKGQNPPHSAEHWGETAALWQQALNLLDQVPRYDASYAIAQAKKAEYQDYLQQIQARQLSAQNRMIAATPQFSRATPTPAAAHAAPTAKPTLQPRTTVEPAAQTAPPQTPQDDFLTTAKRYGWQASLAGKNAPHPIEKWVTIARLWQRALIELNKIEPQHPSYAEAQQVRAQYEQNLIVIRQRYREEQDANQRFQSLQAALLEIESTQLGANDIKRSQMKAIVNRLNTIPANTVTYQQVQPLIARTNEKIQAIATLASTQAAISTSRNN